MGNNRDIFDRMKGGEPIRLDDPEYHKVQEVVNHTIELSAKLNASTNIDHWLGLCASHQQ